MYLRTVNELTEVEVGPAVWNCGTEAWRKMVARSLSFIAQCKSLNQHVPSEENLTKVTHSSKWVGRIWDLSSVKAKQNIIASWFVDFKY